MGFWEMLGVASVPVVQVMLIGLVGAFLASGYSGALSADARKQMNKVVYLVFTPSLIFASLASTITLNDIISWWFMPVNIGIIFIIGGCLSWLAVKLLKPEPYLNGLIIAVCSAPNLGNLMVIVVPAICNENGSPFGETTLCRSRGFSYSAFSMALGGFYIWTHTFSLMRNSAKIHKRMVAAGDTKDLETPLLPSNGTKIVEDEAPKNFLKKSRDSLLQIAEEFTSPPTVAASMGLIVGATPWLKSLIIGAGAPLRAVYDSINLMGSGTIPCITLILGGNLTQGMAKSRLKMSIILAVLLVKMILLPATGIAITEIVARMGFLPADPLFRYTLLMQYTIPPAMNIGTMAELFDVAREECSVLFLWTYLLSALALTLWSSAYLWMLS